MKEIVVLASGGGSNFQSLISAIESGELPNVRIRCLITDRLCPAIKRAEKHKISYVVLDRKNAPVLNVNAMAILCHQADLIVCAGYLSVISRQVIQLFQNRIINIHPSLLPNFGGVGMYGLNVHKAVLEAGERETGCTVHYVDEGIDTGKLIAQGVVEVSMLDDPDSLQSKVQQLEHRLLPRIVKELLNMSNPR